MFAADESAYADAIVVVPDASAPAPVMYPLPSGRVVQAFAWHGADELVVAEDRGTVLFLWLERTPEGHWNGSDHFLVGVDPETGDARWVTTL